MRSVIGLVGPIASGKGNVADMLKEKGFSVYSLSERVREEQKTRGLPGNRETLQNIGDNLRLEFGDQVLAERTVRSIEQDDPSLVVVDSIRNPGEIEFLEKVFPTIIIIGITASPEIRFEYMTARNREGDPKTWKEFVIADQRDKGEGQEGYGQQVHACLEMSNVIIRNEGTIQELQEQIREFLISSGIEGTSRSKERGQ